MQPAKLAEFWGGVVKSYLTGADLEVSSRNLEADQLVDFGQTIHCLELITYLKERNQIAGDLPDQLIEVSRDQRRQTAALNGMLKDTAARIKNRRSNRKLVWLKGARFLLDSVYPAGLRRMSDLDLLVRKADLSYWDRVFRELGFKPHRKVEWITSENFSPYVSSTCYHRSGEGASIMLDVHWHLVDFPARRSCGHWDFSMTEIWQEVKGCRLRPEHSFLYTIDHLFTHSFRLWKAYLDLAQLQANNNLDRHIISREADRINLLEIYRMASSLGEKLFQLKLPELEKTTEASSHYRAVHESFVCEVEAGDLKHGEYLWVCVRDIPGLLGKMFFCLTVLFPPPAAISRLAGRPSMPVLIGGYLKRAVKIIFEVFVYLTTSQFRGLLKRFK